MSLSPSAVSPSGSFGNLQSIGSSEHKRIGGGSGSGGEKYSSISTLERQYAPPVGTRLTLVVRTNGSCAVPGGLESVLKSLRRGGAGAGAGSRFGISQGGGGETAPSTSATRQPQGQGRGGPIDFLSGSFNAALTLTDGNGSGANGAIVPAGGGDSADEDFINTYSAQQNQQLSATAPRPPKFGMGMIQSKLARAARATQEGLAHGVTAVAIRADAAGRGEKGRRPDWISLGAFCRGTCLGATEWKETPTGDSDGDLSVLFAVPVVLPPELCSPPPGSGAGGAADTELELRLFIRSGAAILKKAGGINKHYVLGSGALRVSALARALSDGLQAAANNPLHAGTLAAPLYGPALPADGSAALEILVLPDLKIPPLCGQGWTLADPRADSAYLGGSTGGMLFNFPLDQSYVYQPPSSGTGGALVGTERATESAVVLPIAAAVMGVMKGAAQVSLDHASHATRLVRERALVFDDPARAIEAGYAQCQVDIRYLLLSRPSNQTALATGGTMLATARLSLQRPDTVFESPLGDGRIPVYRSDLAPNPGVDTSPALSVPFYPRVCPEDDPCLLPGLTQTCAGCRVGSMPRRSFLGTVRIEIREEAEMGMRENPFGMGPMTGRVPNLAAAASLVAENRASPPTSSGVYNTNAPNPILEAHVEIDGYVNNPSARQIVQVPLFERETGRHVGTVVMALHALIAPANSVGAPVAQAKGGLVSLVGIDALTETDGSWPLLDFDADFPAVVAPMDGASTKRRRQLSTLGDFVTHGYLQDHVSRVRSVDTTVLAQRHKLYRLALDRSLSAMAGGDGAGGGEGRESFDLPAHQRKDPRPFRPSSSRLDASLSGIGFNVHIVTFSLTDVASGGSGSALPQVRPAALFHSVTCGAPSDHYRGFGGASSDVPHSTARGYHGGLRRLESSRLDVHRRLRSAQDDLIRAVLSHFGDIGQRHQRIMAGSAGTTAPQGSRRHVPPDLAHIKRLRKVAYDSAMDLHSRTWDVAMRRVSCFSQALGIGVTSYLSSLSDTAKIMGPSGGSSWAELVKTRGYLLSFEGLLSAAGKEAGMIEDASVGISMLRMVSVTLLPADGRPQTGRLGSGPIPVPHSAYVRWIDLIHSGVGSGTQYRLEIALDPGYFAQRVPSALKDGAEVRFYPLLYQMGVDIRQWGANVGMNAKNTSRNIPMSRQGSAVSDGGGGDDGADPTGAAGGGGLLDDEDDDVGIPDNDLLMALNYEALRKMNAYAHGVVPTADSASAALSWEQADLQPQQQVVIHPMLAKLHNYIRTSSGRMEHGVLDEASSASANLGGSSAIFCKSGKDRTAMQVTYKQARFVRRFLKCGDGNRLVEVEGDTTLRDAVYSDATLMRIHGTRLPICEKNVGQAKFAFNSLQSKFMPEALKPPPNTLAGFLKGGRVFSRDGGIES